MHEQDAQHVQGLCVVNIGGGEVHTEQDRIASILMAINPNALSAQHARDIPDGYFSTCIMRAQVTCLRAIGLARDMSLAAHVAL